MDATPVLGFLSVIFITVSAYLGMKLKEVLPQLKQAKLAIEMFSETGEDGLKLLSNLWDVLDALMKAVEDGVISNEEASVIMEKGKPLIIEGKEILKSPTFEQLKNLVEGYKR